MFINEDLKRYYQYVLRSLYMLGYECVLGKKKKKKKSQSLSITCLQTINTRTLEKKNVLWSLWIANPRKVGGWIIQISYSCWSDFSRWKNLHFPCAGKTYPASPDIYYSFPLQISKSSCYSKISIHMLTCSWIAYFGRVNLTSALKL